jgi:hypothetical protein
VLGPDDPFQELEAIAEKKEEVMSIKVFRLACGFAVAAALMMAGVLKADSYDKRTVFTFNRPISVPGVTLPAGKYMFRLVDTETSRKVVQVLDEHGKKPYAMLHTIPEIRRSWKPPRVSRPR